VGSASGGILKTGNGGRSFQFVFDKGGSSAIGAVSVSQTDPNLVWVGTGEGWQRNDSGWGDGIYKSTDGGLTWTNMGLSESNSFSKIVIDPQNNNTVFAAALGSQWGPGPERGIFRTTDDGKTWAKVLYVNGTTGASDLVIDPRNHKELLAAMWDHEHHPYHYRFWGPGSGVYRSTDGGNTWQKVTKGLPQTEMGRIAIDCFPKDSRYVAAAIEAKPPATGFYRSEDGGENWIEMPAEPLDKDGKPRPQERGAQWGRPYYNNWIRYDPVDVNKIYQANPEHFTTNGGRNFYLNDHDDGNDLDDHALWIDPHNPKHMLEAGDQGVREIWVGGDPQRAHWAEGDFKWLHLPPLGQFYAVGYDMRKPYWVMGGTQDNGSVTLPTQSWHKGVSVADLAYLNCGDGGDAMADPYDWSTVYTACEDGTIPRIDLIHGTIDWLKPNGDSVLGAYQDPSTIQRYLASNPRVRVSLVAPISVSPWNSQTIFFGANYLFKSVDRGDHWSIVSPDLSHDNMAWQVPNPMYATRPWGQSWEGTDSYQTIVTISESDVQQGVIWAGTDDGNVQLTTDGGKHWANVTGNIAGVPEYTWVSHIESSHFVPGRAYVTFDGHRNLDYNTYVYVTEDYGETWRKITTNLPARESCYVVKEGLRNPNLLFLGTERSLWVSLDRGDNWSRYQSWELRDKHKGYFPTVAVYDLQEQPRELDLIVGTHGRSIWSLPIKALEELTAEHMQQDVYFASPGNVYLFPVQDNPISDGVSDGPSFDGWFSPNTQPGTRFYYHLKQDDVSEATIAITDASGDETYAILKGPAKAGLNVVPWGAEDGDERIPLRRPGDYRAVLTIGGKEYTQTLHVEDVSRNSVLTAPPPNYPTNEVVKPAEH